MKMSDVKVGMRLRSIYGLKDGSDVITVTGITAHGYTFKYDEPLMLGPRIGVSEGGEHFGHKGESLYVPIDGKEEFYLSPGAWGMIAIGLAFVAIVCFGAMLGKTIMELLP